MVLIGLQFVGCSAGAPPVVETEAVDPDDVPITEADVELPATYRDAVARLCGYRDQIRDAIAAGRPGKAHRPLDEIEIVLERMPYLARKDGVPKRQWETVVVASEDISELFNQVHSAIDDHRQPDYEAVAAPIEDALGRLAAVKP